MSIDEIVRAWKADDEGDDKDEKDDKGGKTPENPAGQELSDEELQQAAGGLKCDWDSQCQDTCAPPTWSI